MKAQAQSPFSGDCKTKEWDPHTTFGIINPHQGTFTCVGYAPSKHRRCRNPIARAGRDFVYELLELLALISTSSHEFAILLQEAACRSLCWRHGSQVDSVVEQWGASISEDRKQSKSRLKTSQTTGSHYTRYTDDDTKTKTDDRKQKEQAQEYQRREQDRERKKKQKEQDKRKKEQEQREEEARERRRREAQQQREEREWRGRDQAVKERRDWQQAWQSYATKWAAFREAKHEPSTPQQAQLLIPWPVKSGRFDDVKASDVKTFYREACPTARTPAMFKTIQDESLKWHPDKMRMLYRTCTPGDADKLVIEMICRAVLDLREEAKAMRSG